MAKKILHANEINGDLVEKVWRGGWTELILCSEGGDIYAARSVCDYLLSHEKRVVVTGQCMSSATAIVACGAPALCTPGTRFMVHPSYASGVDGKEHEIKNHAEELRVFNEWYLDLLEQRTGTKRAKWLDLFDQEAHFNSKVALQLGLVDEIL